MDFRFMPGVIQSPGDPRDYIYRAIVKAEKLPEKFSRRNEYGSVRDQERYGSCVGFASAAVKDNQESRNYSETMVTSPLFIYAMCKKMDGIPHTEGTYPRVAMKVLQKKGVCLEKTFPYSEMSWPKMPEIPEGAKNEAEQFKIGAYARIQTIDEVKQAVVKEGPVLGAILICDNFHPDNADGFIEMPKGKVLGGHAICVVGYDNNLKYKEHTGFFEVRNSWGKSWGDKGYCWIPYDFFIYRSITGMSYWIESWSSVDIILPPKTAKEIIIWKGKRTVLVDGKEIELKKPLITGKINTTLLPLDFISKKLGYKVKWYSKERKLRIWKQ